MHKALPLSPFSGPHETCSRAAKGHPRDGQRAGPAEPLGAAFPWTYRIRLVGDGEDGCSALQGSPCVPGGEQRFTGTAPFNHLTDDCLSDTTWTAWEMQFPGSSLSWVLSYPGWQTVGARGDRKGDRESSPSVRKRGSPASPASLSLSPPHAWRSPWRLGPLVGPRLGLQRQWRRWVCRRGLGTRWPQS